MHEARIPVATTLEIMAARQKITDRHEIEEDNRKADRRQIRRAASTPADPARREHLERIDRPADDREEDFRILELHRLHTRLVPRRLSRPDPADDQPYREKHPADDDRALVHRVEHLKRREAPVEITKVFAFDFLE